MAKVETTENPQERLTIFVRDVIYQSHDNKKIVWCTKSGTDTLHGFTLKDSEEQGVDLHGIHIQNYKSGWKIFEGTLTISNEE